MTKYCTEVLVGSTCYERRYAFLNHFSGDAAEPFGKACIGTVKGDMHDIGKNLSVAMIEEKGIEIIDLASISPQDSRKMCD